MKLFSMSRAAQAAKILFCLIAVFSCSGFEHPKATADAAQQGAQADKTQEAIVNGIDQPTAYLPLIKDKRVALVVNQTSVMADNTTHLADALIAKGVAVKLIFAPEHGFRGNVEAGGHVAGGTDSKTGLPVASLYGANKKPSAAQLKDIDVVIFDIQDVGARFYTYISTLHLVMDACAEQGKKLIVLDRPNPNGYFIDGPIREKKYKSFVAMDPIPVVHGCTVGELAGMINGEGWLESGKKCDLTVIPCQNYNHSLGYELPIPPSPNLPTLASIYLYPSLCFFEGTDVSVGRGTDHPFECIGKPGFSSGDYEFTPRRIPGKSEDPPYNGQRCRGFLLTSFAADYIRKSNELYLEFLIGFYSESKDKAKFFNGMFDKLAGNASMREMIIAGKSAKEIRATWQADLDAYRVTRKKYLLYP